MRIESNESPAPLPSGVTDSSAWERFTKLIAEKLGPIPDSIRRELQLVDHHHRNTIPFLTDHGVLAGSSVLEFGAGTGGLSVAMVLAGSGQVDAVEPVELNCEAGRWRTTACGIEASIRFHQVADTRILSFEDDSFDLVTCSSVLQYIPDFEHRRAVLSELARVLRPGGMLAICNTGNSLLPGGPHSSKWWSNLVPAKAARLGHGRGVSYWELNRTLRPLGFHAESQAKAAIKRWRTRASSRGWSLRRVAVAMAITGVQISGGLLSLITRAPVEAFLPFPELAFRKDGKSRLDPRSQQSQKLA